MKKKKITAIMAVIMMAAGLSACSQSNAKLEGKSGIVKDEASKTEGDTSVVDQTPATYVQDAEYVNKDDIVSVDDTIEINGITYKIEKYEHTTEFGNRNKDTVLDYLKDSYEGNIDENYNLSNGYSYLFITLTFTYKDGDDKQLEGNRNAGILYAIKDDMERIQQNSDSVYIDSYWLGGDESDVYHYVLGKGEGITSELGYIIQDEGIPEDSKYIYYCIEGIDSKTNDKVQKYFKLEL
ncbi:MAG: hypothetical protein ACLT0M_02485 [Agathobacter rectalis]